MTELLDNFHFLRPAFLWLLPLAWLAIMAMKSAIKNHSSWSQVIDKSLLPHLLHNGEHNGEHTSSNTRFYTAANSSLVLAWCIACFALAGPSWEQLKQPVVKKQDALILILDLSLSMYAEDQKPSRIIAAKRKLKDILQQRKEGLSALIVYSGDAHVVSPLTDDNKTISTLLPALEPKIMPKFGSNLHAAIMLSDDLLKNAGLNKARVLILSDEIKSGQLDKIMANINKNIELSILTFGTTNGAPIPLPAPFKEGFLKNKSGNAVLTKLNKSEIFSAAHQHGIQITASRIDDSDIKYLQENAQEINKDNTPQDRKFDIWQDRGHLLSLLLIPLLLLSFRRGILLLALIVIFPSDSFAQNEDNPSSPSWSEKAHQLWTNAWHTADQQAEQSFNKGEHKKAANTFKDTQWQASSLYKNADYEASATAFAQGNDATADYNRGNALAHLGKMDDAIKAYNSALKKDPNFDDAKANKKLLEALKKQQEEEQKDQEKQEGDSDDKEDGESSEQDQEDSENKSEESEQESDQKSEENSEQESSQQNKDEQEQEEDNKESEPQALPEEQGEELSDDEKQQLMQDAAEQAMTNEEKEQQQALQQWLRRIPEDSGKLLENKFKHQYEQNRRNNDLLDKESEQLW